MAHNGTVMQKLGGRERERAGGRERERKRERGQFEQQTGLATPSLIKRTQMSHLWGWAWKVSAEDPCPIFHTAQTTMRTRQSKVVQGTLQENHSLHRKFSVILVIVGLSNGGLLKRSETRSHCHGIANTKNLHFLKQSGKLFLKNKLPKNIQPTVQNN